MKIFTHPECVLYEAPGHPERPQRISATLERLKAQKQLELTIEPPGKSSDQAILRAHSVTHLERLKQPIPFDADTPFYPNLVDHARRAVAGACAAMESAIAGMPAFSLFRPPGHHAETDRAMGFCYLNQIAIATLEAVARGFQKVAVFDFDVHHGNGTEEILQNKSNVAYFSVHQNPGYPGTGTEHFSNCFNYPMPPGISRAAYRQALTRGLESIRNYGPDLIAVSAGFDAYEHDPLAQQALKVEDFHWLGQEVRRFGVPHFSVLEGGYSDDLPELILAYLKGLDGRDCN